MGGALEGIRILDLGWVLAGPFCTMILGDLGAEVIKIEKPGVGDLARGNGPFIGNESSYFMSVNRNKKSLTIDLRKTGGKDLFLRLVEQADAVVENFVPGTMKDLGLDYVTVSGRNPRIIYASLSGFGQDGPYAGKRALDIVVQAMGGMMSITGEPDGPPVKPGASLADITAGLYTAIGILTALYEREKSGKGQYLDISMLDCQLSVLENALARYFATGETPRRVGNRHPVYSPFQSFETADGYLALALVGGTRNQWQLFCAQIDRVDLMDDERYQTGESRTEHYAELEPIICEILKTQPTSYWLDKLDEVGIPCGPVNSIDEVASNPQVQARDMIVDVPHTTLGTVKAVNSPLKLSRTPGRIETAAPALGENTRALLQNILGLTGEELDRLSDNGII